MDWFLKTDIKPKAEAKSSASMVRPFNRFDPENEEHVRWMQEFERARRLEAGDEVEPEPGDDDEPKVVRKKEKKRKAAPEPTKENKQRFYHMDDDFLKHLRDAQNAIPDISSFFTGSAPVKRDPVEEEAASSSEDETIPAKRAREEEKPGVEGADGDVKPKLGRGPVKKDEDEIGEDVSQADLSKKVELNRIPFFFTGDEPAVRSVVSNFRRTQDEEKIKAKWGKYQQKVWNIVTSMKKNAKRAQKERGLKYDYSRRDTPHQAA